MTLWQRAQWAKNKLWPRWSFLLKILQPSQEQLKQLTSIMVEAIWIGGRHWLSATEVAAKYSMGGLEAILPQDKVDVLRIMMFARLWTSNKASHMYQLAEIILDQYAGPKMGFGIIHSKSDNQKLSRLPKVYAAAVVALDRLSISIFPSCKQDILQLPVIKSRFLLQLEEPVVVSGLMAKSLNVITIGDLYDLIPHATRFSENMIATVRQAVDAEDWLPKANEEVALLDNERSFKEQSTHLLPYIQVEDLSLPINNWSNAKIAKILRCDLEVKKGEKVPSETWKILMAVNGPEAFLNQAWKFLHHCTPTPRFYYNLGILKSMNCVLCQSDDITYEHQFKTCSVLEKTLEILEDFRSRLELPLLENQYQLYPSPRDEERLGNFLIVSFLYTIMLVTRSVANQNGLEELQEGKFSK